MQVAEDHLPESSVAACMVHCLEKPDITHIMVSYRQPNFLGIGGQFNCICAKVLNAGSFTELYNSGCLLAKFKHGQKRVNRWRNNLLIVRRGRWRRLNMKAMTSVRLGVLMTTRMSVVTSPRVS